MSFNFPTRCSTSLVKGTSEPLGRVWLLKDGRGGGSSRSPPKGGVEEPVRVPGSRANAVDPAALWRALPRFLLCGMNTFKNSFSTLFDAWDTPSGASCSSPWPMPLPHPGVFHGKLALDCESPGLQRDPLSIAVNLPVAVFSWLRLGRP